MTLLLAAMLSALMISLCFSSALFHFSRSRLERYCQSRNVGRLDRILRAEKQSLLAARVWTWTVLAALCMAVVVEAASTGNAAAKMLLLWLTVASADLLIAQPLGRAAAEPVLYWLFPVIDWLRLAVSPLLWVERRIGGLAVKLSGRPDDPHYNPIHDEILSAVNEGEREGTIHEDAADMIEGLMELHEAAVADIMTPRTDMVMLRSNATLQEARAAIIEHGHSRIPVYGDNRDDIRGVLYAKDLLPFLDAKEGAPSDISRLKLRKPVFVPESKPVNVMLREFQRGHVHMAVVLDEYAGVAGLVTIEDILEEIVGEITDEHDPTEPAPIQRLDERTIEADARVHVEDLNEIIPLSLPEDSHFDTVGGFVFNHLGRIPKQGESFEIDHANFTILKASERAVERVRIELATAGEKIDAPEAAGG